MSVEGWEHCVALGSVGFSRGIHYWEFTIDKYTADTDPAFGVARIDVARDKMLGKCKVTVGILYIKVEMNGMVWRIAIAIFLITYKWRRGKSTQRQLMAFVPVLYACKCV